MNLSAKEALDAELRASKIRKVFYITVVVVLIISAFTLTLSNSETEGSYVVGQTVSRYTKQHDEGHTNYLKVKVPTEEKLVVVRVPVTSQVLLKKTLN